MLLVVNQKVVQDLDLKRLLIEIQIKLQRIQQLIRSQIQRIIEYQEIEIINKQQIITQIDSLKQQREAENIQEQFELLLNKKNNQLNEQNFLLLQKMNKDEIINKLEKTNENYTKLTCQNEQINQEIKEKDFKINSLLDQVKQPYQVSLIRLESTQEIRESKEQIKRELQMQQRLFNDVHLIQQAVLEQQKLILQIQQNREEGLRLEINRMQKQLEQMVKQIYRLEVKFNRNVVFSNISLLRIQEVIVIQK